jgi:hypothetical protein
MLHRRVSALLKIHATLFFLISILFIIAPAQFLELLEVTVDATPPHLWSLELLGIALIMVSILLIFCANNFGEKNLRLVASFALFLTIATCLSIAQAPWEYGVGKWVSLLVGAIFSLAYLWALRGYRSVR